MRKAASGTGRGPGGRKGAREGGGETRLRVKVVTRARQSGFRGLMADGSARIALRSPPVDGRANDELRELLAGEFGVSVADVTISSGLTGRWKTVRIVAPSRTPRWAGDQTSGDDGDGA